MIFRDTKDQVSDTAQNRWDYCAGVIKKSTELSLGLETRPQRSLWYENSTLATEEMNAEEEEENSQEEQQRNTAIREGKRKESIGERKKLGKDSDSGTRRILEFL